MGGYNASEKDTIATNLNLYTKAGADARFAALENLFQDYIDFLTGQGKSPMEARQLLRNKLDVLSKDEIVKDYLRKDGKLSDLSLPTAEAKRQACRAIGAAYAEEYQPLLADTGWMHMENSGSGTDTQGLFIRQIGISCPYRGISIPHAGTAATGAASLPSSRTRYSPRDTACAAAPLTGTMTTSTTGAPRSPSTAVRAGYSFTSAVCTMSM